MVGPSYRLNLFKAESIIRKIGKITDLHLSALVKHQSWERIIIMLVILSFFTVGISNLVHLIAGLRMEIALNLQLWHSKLFRLKQSSMDKMHTNLQ